MKISFAVALMAAMQLVEPLTNQVNAVAVDLEDNAIAAELEPENVVLAQGTTTEEEEDSPDTSEID